LLPIVLMVGLLCASAFFSASETALFSLGRETMALLARDIRAVRLLAASPRSLLATVLLGNLTVNILFYSTAARLGMGLAEAGRPRAAFVVGVCAFVALVLFGEVLPKTYAVRHARGVSRLCATPLYLTGRVLWPVRLFLEKLTDACTGLVAGRSSAPGGTTSAEMAYLLDEAVASRAMQPRERAMLAGALSLKSLRVRDVMVPRVDAVMCEAAATREELLELARECGHTKIPLYEGTIDRVVGVVYVKNLFASQDKEPRDVAGEVPFVPAGKTVEGLLGTLLERKLHLAVVLDEYGGTAGIVTIEDIAEEIVGELQDEYDGEAESLIRLPDGRLSLSGRMTLREFHEAFGVNIECPEVSTLGGLATFAGGALAEPGDEFDFGGIRFIVESVRHRRVERVIVEALPGEGGGNGQDTVGLSGGTGPDGSTEPSKEDARGECGRSRDGRRGGKA